jgi:dihydrofolate reductase
MHFKMIVAVDKMNGIGKSNTIPWHLPEDLKHFAKLTKGNGNNAVIMGRKTFDSIGRALLKRKNLVLTRDKNLDQQNENVQYFNSVYDIKKHCIISNYDEVWIIGGSTIYNEFLSSVKELYITEIDGDFHCDTFFVEDYKSFFKDCEVRYGGLMDEKYTFFYKKYFS